MITLIRFIKFIIISISLFILIIFSISTYENGRFEKTLKRATSTEMPCYIMSNNPQDLIGCYNNASRLFYTSFDEDKINVGYSTLYFLCNSKKFQIACSSLDTELIRIKEHLNPNLYDIQNILENSKHLVNINSQIWLGSFRELINDNSLWPFIFDSMDSKKLMQEKISYLNDGIYHTDSKYDQNYLKNNLHKEHEYILKNAIACKSYVESEFLTPGLNKFKIQDLCDFKVFKIEQYLYYLPFLTIEKINENKVTLDFESWKLKEQNKLVNFSHSNLVNNFNFKNLPPREFSRHTLFSRAYDIFKFWEYDFRMTKSCNKSDFTHCENIISLRSANDTVINNLCEYGNKPICDYLAKRNSYEQYLGIDQKNNQYIYYDGYSYSSGGSNIQDVLWTYKNLPNIKLIKKIERFIIPAITFFLFIFTSTIFLVLTSSEKLKLIQDHYKKEKMNKILDSIKSLK